MRITVKDIEARLGNNGIVLNIADNQGHHEGKLRVGQATLEWCKRRTRIGNAKKIPMADFIAKLDEI